MGVYTGLSNDQNKLNQDKSPDQKLDGSSTKKQDCDEEVTPRKNTPSISISRSSKARIQLSTGKYCNICILSQLQ